MSMSNMGNKKEMPSGHVQHGAPMSMTMDGAAAAAMVAAQVGAHAMHQHHQHHLPHAHPGMMMGPSHQVMMQQAHGAGGSTEPVRVNVKFEGVGAHPYGRELSIVANMADPINSVKAKIMAHLNGPSAATGTHNVYREEMLQFSVGNKKFSDGLGFLRDYGNVDDFARGSGYSDCILVAGTTAMAVHHRHDCEEV